MSKSAKIIIVSICLLCTAVLCAGCGGTSEIKMPSVPTLPPKATATPAPTPYVRPVPAAVEESAEDEEDAPVTPEPLPDKPAVPEQTAPPVDPDIPILSITGETLPQDMEQLNVCDLRGIISVDKGYIRKVCAGLVNSRGETVQYCEFYPNSGSFSLGGTVNEELVFIYLEADTYTYIVEAEAVNNERVSMETLIYHSFSVVPRGGAAQQAKPAVQPALSGGTGAAAFGAADGEYIARFTDDRSNTGRIWNFLVYELKNPYGAAGVLANIQIESKCDPNRLQGDQSEDGSFSATYTRSVASGEVDRDGFVSNAVGGGYGPGYGLCQWTGERKAGLYDLAAERGVSVGDLETQCMFILREMKQSYPALLEYLMTATDAGDAALEFCGVYEQSSDRAGRTDRARELLETYAR